MNKSYEGLTLNLTCEHLSMSVQVCKHESIQAYEHFSTQVYIPLISQSTLHSSIIVNAFELMNAKLHDHLNLQAYRHIIIQVCAYV